MSPPTRRQLLAVTALDVLIAVILLLAVVIEVTGGSRFTMGPLRISMTNPARPMAWAAALACVRCWFWRHVALLAMLPKPVAFLRRTVYAGKEEFIAARRPPANLAYWVGALVALSLVPLWPHLTNVAAVPDPGDPYFSAWRVAWVAHQIVRSPFELFDANAFYPTPLTLSYSDSILLPALAGAPLIWMGIDPIIAANTVFLGAFPLAAVAFLFAALRLTGDLRASFVAGLIGGLYPFHFEHYSHLELQFFFWIPLALVATLRLLARPSAALGVVLGLLVAGQWFSSMYFGIMLVTYLVPFTLVIARGWRIRPSWPLARAAAGVVVVLALTLPLLALLYIWSRAEHGDRNLPEVEYYSAMPVDYIEAHERSATYGRILRRNPSPERQLFPGATPLALSLLALPPPLPAPALATFVAGAVAMDASLGVHGLSYPQLYRWVTPYRGMRVPARFAIFVGSSLILLSAYGLRRLFRLRVSRHVRTGMFALVVAGVLADLWPAIEVRRYWPSRPPVYEAVTADMVLAEFPMRNEPNFAYQYFSTAHWARLLNGNSGFSPRTYLDLERAMEEFPSDATLAMLRERGATHITVTCAFYQSRSECGRTLEILDQSHGVHLLSQGQWEGAEVRLYRLSS